MRVLIVEDDEDLRYGVAGALRSAGLAVDTAADLPEADESLTVNEYDCVVFDRILPAGDALDYVRERRDAGWTPAVLFLTARDSTADRVAGFEHGGDDYLVKPFATAELIARVRNLCRRGQVTRPPVLRHADIELDTARRQARRAGVLLTLTGKEFAVLEQLMIREGGVVGRGVLIEHCWDAMAEPLSNVVDVVIANLRRKLGDPQPIVTVRGAGYRLT
ncbi:response regulator transcription factor [Actinomadura graeca]|uniref:Response regulator transcription factor n=1 Tax=Actinomadura graeca TaxID=2750812 RepID=A0ABX8QVK8_9ACTN|nr:response regulator transcription factor [Actinomadura graeca]QXJ22870.1 response regulator transcription factor [Actinomadura graeca]